VTPRLFVRYCVAAWCAAEDSFLYELGKGAARILFSNKKVHDLLFKGNLRWRS
jgi:hypothetical protein